MSPLIMIALQAAPVTAPASSDAQRWSILVPVADAPCRQRAENGTDIVVCAKSLPSQRLPYPDEVPAKGPVASNPFRTGTNALAVESTPCAVRSEGCIVGFGPPIIPMIKGAVDLAKRAFARKPDKTGRVPIDIDTPAPTGTVLP
ncbi:hypothetical protein [uncultured Sphingomonas sp.]|uniref:hypothetical protein n=1 Tax=uncultured Sphingomonas sp. TaxID=158754 RepID=UPI0035CACBBF